MQYINPYPKDISLNIIYINEYAHLYGYVLIILMYNTM